jgi:hypothetical protein
VNLKGAKQGNFSSAGSGGWVKTGQFSGRIENGVMSGSGRLVYDDGTIFEVTITYQTPSSKPTKALKALNPNPKP